jgi:hypothetical protein
MVKNETGGNRSKKVARKTVENPQTSQRVRYIEDAGEMYAICTAKFGGRNIQVMCHDGVSRRCIIRNKFMKLKGDNSIAIGTWLMVGIYEWEKRVDCSKTCDVLEVYLRSEREKIKQNVNISVIKHIVTVSDELEDNKKGNELAFSDLSNAFPEQENIHIADKNIVEDNWWVPPESDGDDDGGEINDGGEKYPQSNNLLEAIPKTNQTLYKEKDVEKTTKIKEARRCKTETAFIHEDDI